MPAPLAPPFESLTHPLIHFAFAVSDLAGATAASDTINDNAKQHHIILFIFKSPRAGTIFLSSFESHELYVRVAVGAITIRQQNILPQLLQSQSAGKLYFQGDFPIPLRLSRKVA